MSALGRVLLLLPCNRGAKIGDYFVGVYWRVAVRWLEKLGIRSHVVLGAVDCIPHKYGLGDCVVLEWEMSRVRGYDVYPSYDPMIVDGLSRCVEAGLRRCLSLFDRIYVVLNVRLYQEAVKLALERIDDGKILFFRPERNMPGYMNRKIIEVVRKIARDIEL